MQLKLKMKGLPKGKGKAPVPAAQVVVGKGPPEAVQVPTSFKEVYPLIEPYAYAAITRDPKTAGMLYYVIEPTLLEEDKEYYSKLRSILTEELDVDVRKIESKEAAEKLLRDKVDTIVKSYKLKIEAETLDKLMYYLNRDLINFGRIEPLMRDHMLEDISCDGPDVPLYVWHRQYESYQRT